MADPRTYDCPSTLTDTQVLDFCKNGYLLLEGVVADEINQRATKYLDGDDFYEPTGILEQDWFVENVTLNPVAAGAVRALLGADFHTPVLMSNHRVQCPAPLGNWHHDADSLFGAESGGAVQRVELALSGTNRSGRRPGAGKRFPGDRDAE